MAPIIDSLGNQLWYKGNRLHREDGPAIIYADGTQEWYIDGYCHREDGPAYIHISGTVEWCLNDNEYSFDEWCNQLNLSDTDRLYYILRFNNNQENDYGNIASH